MNKANTFSPSSVDNFAQWCTDLQDQAEEKQVDALIAEALLPSPEEIDRLVNAMILDALSPSSVEDDDSFANPINNARSKTRTDIKWTYYQAA